MKSRLERLLRIAEELRRGSYPSLERLCAMFEVKPRTIYGDLKELKERAGLTIHFSRSYNGYVINDPTTRLPAFDLSEGEMVALLAAANLLSATAGSAYEQVLRSAIDKIMDRLAHPVRDNVTRLRAVMNFEQEQAALWSWTLFLNLVTAATTRKRVELSLSGATAATSPYTVEAHLLVCRGDGWHLQCIEAEAAQEKTIPLKSIERCKILLKSE